MEEVSIWVVELNGGGFGEKFADTEVAHQKAADELILEEARVIEGIEKLGQHLLVAVGVEAVDDLIADKLHDDLHECVDHLQQPHSATALLHLCLVFRVSAVVLPYRLLQCLLQDMALASHHDLLKVRVDLPERLLPELVNLALHEILVDRLEAQLYLAGQPEGGQLEQEISKLLKERVGISRRAKEYLFPLQYSPHQLANAVSLVAAEVGGLKQLLVVLLSADAFGVNCDVPVGLAAIDEDPAAGSQRGHFLLGLKEDEHGDKLGQHLGDVLEGHVDGVCRVEDEHELYLFCDIHEVVHGDKVGA